MKEFTQPKMLILCADMKFPKNLHHERKRKQKLSNNESEESTAAKQKRYYHNNIQKKSLKYSWFWSKNFLVMILNSFESHLFFISLGSLLNNLGPK